MAVFHWLSPMINKGEPELGRGIIPIWLSASWLQMQTAATVSANWMKSNSIVWAQLRHTVLNCSCQVFFQNKKKSYCISMFLYFPVISSTEWLKEIPVYLLDHQESPRWNFYLVCQCCISDRKIFFILPRQCHQRGGDYQFYVCKFLKII